MSDPSRDDDHASVARASQTRLQGAAGAPSAPGTEHFDTLEPRVARVLQFILQIAGGDFTSRETVSERGDEMDAITVGLNMLAESFERERLLRDRAEALLADAVDSYENAPGLFCSVGAQSFYIAKCNQTLADAVGLSKRALEGRSILDLCTPSSRDELERALRAIASASPPGPRAPEVELQRAGRTPLTVSVTGSVMYDEHHLPLRLRLSLRDVTVERQLETQLLHVQKMEAIGQLAGGVAHDFNNLLMIIQSAATMLARQIAPGGSPASLLAQVQEATQRAATLTRQLLTFARPEASRPTDVDVAALLLRDEAMLQRLLGSSIQLEVKVDSYDCLVRIDAARLEQALMNLVINARDAMPGGGKLKVELDLATLEHGSDKHVRLCVTDSGVGIPLAIQSRIFEPFFTTKPQGSGTGLGLAMVYGIVRQAGGETRVHSEPGKGARFELYFPKVIVHARPLTPPPQLEIVGGSERVLVVEDDADVRTLTVLILRDGGYEVHEADCAAKALALPRSLLESLQLVVSDVIMPGMPGPQLVEHLSKTFPKLRSVLVSGYPADHRIGEHWFLPKPFGPTQLLRIVRERLDAEG